uniref:Uncharacterized protein n=1 Tax=Parascaris univalens TaxID=6257 RepID=A0A915BRZ3_PARUN
NLVKLKMTVTNEIQEKPVPIQAPKDAVTYLCLVPFGRLSLKKEFNKDGAANVSQLHFDDPR